MAVVITLRITAQDPDALEAALNRIVDEADECDYSAEGISDLLGARYAEGGYVVETTYEEAA